MYYTCCIIPIFSILLAADSLLCILWSWLYQGSTVGVLYPECLFVILTQCYCVSVSGIRSQINFEDADCFVIRTLCQVLMACCVLWVENQEEESTRERERERKKNTKRVSLTLRSTSARQTAKRGERGERQRRERGRNKGWRERRKIEIRLPLQNNNFPNRFKRRTRGERF